jgi:hypothetical protein
VPKRAAATLIATLAPSSYSPAEGCPRAISIRADWASADASPPLGAGLQIPGGSPGSTVSSATRHTQRWCAARFVVLPQHAHVPRSARRPDVGNAVLIEETPGPAYRPRTRVAHKDLSASLPTPVGRHILGTSPDQDGAH